MTNATILFPKCSNLWGLRLKFILRLTEDYKIWYEVFKNGINFMSDSDVNNVLLNYFEMNNQKNYENIEINSIIEIIKNFKPKLMNYLILHILLNENNFKFCNDISFFESNVDINNLSIDLMDIIVEKLQIFTKKDVFDSNLTKKIHFLIHLYEFLVKKPYSNDKMAIEFAESDYCDKWLSYINFIRHLYQLNFLIPDLNITTSALYQRAIKLIHKDFVQIFIEKYTLVS